MAGIMQAMGLHRHVLASASAIGCLAPKLARSVSQWATVRPAEISGSNPAHLQNCVGGQWVSSKEEASIPDPMNGEQFIYFPNTGKDETRPFIDSLAACPKHGLHNPLKNPERYNMYGDVSALAAEQLRKPEVAGFFAHLIQRVSPKSHAQAMGEVTITCRFLENFSGDQVRFLAQGFHVSGDHFGQQSQGYRWPYGPTALITPFNFPLEIPALQCMGALYMGNKVLLHVDHRVSVVAEQFLRLLQSCGMPAADMDLIHGFGPVVGHIIQAAQPRNVLFTGSSRVAEQLAAQTRGRLKLEDAGFDWKILGPDVQDVDFVAWQSDQDAYACSGQKCSAQSILFMHENWRRAGVLDRMRHRACMRSLHDLTIGPVLTWTTARILDHVQALLRIPGAEVLFGGKELEGHSIPEVYGAVQPTAVFVPLEEMLKPQYFETATTEVFGPLQVVTEWSDAQEPLVLQALERMQHHLTAAVVSNDPVFCNRILAHSVNGTTYAGIRARTTGAPQNHWFGPAGDPRGAGIGTPEAIRLVWSCHREIIRDVGPVPQGDQAVSHRRPT